MRRQGLRRVPPRRWRASWCSFASLLESRPAVRYRSAAREHSTREGAAEYPPARQRRVKKLGRLRRCAAGVGDLGGQAREQPADRERHDDQVVDDADDRQHVGDEVDRRDDVEDDERGAELRARRARPAGARRYQRRRASPRSTVQRTVRRFHMAHGSCSSPAVDVGPANSPCKRRQSRRDGARPCSPTTQFSAGAPLPFRIDWAAAAA